MEERGSTLILCGRQVPWDQVSRLQSRVQWIPQLGGYGPHPENHPTSARHAIGKRSFKRAFRRAVEFGRPNTKGGVLKPEHFGLSHRTAATATFQAKGRRARPRPSPCLARELKPHLRTLVWNCGGLAYHEFMHWLQTEGTQYHTVATTDTRMSYDMEHMGNSHYLTNSARRDGGVMVVIHTQMASPSFVCWQAVEAGRVLDT